MNTHKNLVDSELQGVTFCVRCWASSFCTVLDVNPLKKKIKNKTSSQQPYRGNSTEILYNTNHNSIWTKEQNDVQLLQSEEKQYKIQEL